MQVPSSPLDASLPSARILPRSKPGSSQPQGGTHGHLGAGRMRASMRGVAWSLVNVLAGTGISTLVFVVTSRVLVPDDFGVVALGLSIVMLVSCVVPFGFGAALVQRRDVEDAHLDATFWLCALTGLVAYGALALGAGQLAALSGSPMLTPVLLVLGLRIVFDALAVVPGALLLRRMDMRSLAVRTVIGNGLGGVICLGLVSFGYGFWALVASQVISSAMTFVVVAAVCGWRPRARLNGRRLRDLARFGLSASGSRAIQEMRLDQIVLGALAGPAVLGLYFFARRLFQMLTDLTVGIFSPVTGVLFASMQDEPEKARQAFLLAGFTAALLGLPLFAGLIVVADTGVPLVFGEQWSGAVLAIRAFAVIGLMAVVGIVQSTLIQGRGHADWWLAYQGASQLLGVPIILVLYPLDGPLGGLDGVMVALVIRTVLLWPLSIRKTLRILDMRVGEWAASLAGPVGATLVLVAAVEVVPLVLPGLEGGARLAVELGVAALAYVAAAGIFVRRRLTLLLQLALRRTGATS